MLLPISMPRFKSIIFYYNCLKIKLFLQEMQNFLALGAPPPDPHHSFPNCEFLATRLRTVLHLRTVLPSLVALA